MISTTVIKVGGGGFWAPIANPLADVLAFFYGLAPNYGIAIVLLTVLMMIVLTPLTIKQTRSMLVMQKLQPEMKKLQEQHKNDRQALNEAVMALYKEHNASPLGGCLPMLLPFPLFNGLPSRGSILTLGPNGNLYGIYGIYGVSGLGLFEVDADGSNLQLFSFYTTQDGGGDPQGMLLATDGNLWINDYNGSDGYGDILTVSPTDGSLIQSFSFFSSTAAVGAYPGVMRQASDGTIWGATGQFGKVPKGKFADGTVFSVNFGLPPK